MEIAKVIYEDSDLPECCRVRDGRSGITVEICTYEFYDENREAAIDKVEALKNA